MIVKKQEVPVVMTETSLIPFYSADATTKLARALSYCKGKHYFLFRQTVWLFNIRV